MKKKTQPKYVPTDEDYRAVRDKLHAGQNLEWYSMSRGWEQNGKSVSDAIVQRILSNHDGRRDRGGQSGKLGSDLIVADTPAQAAERQDAIKAKRERNRRQRLDRWRAEIEKAIRGCPDYLLDKVLESIAEESMSLGSVCDDNTGY